MKFSDVTYDNIKCRKKAGLHPLFARYVFGKTKGGGSDWSPSFLWVHQKPSTCSKKHLNDSKSFVEYLNTMDDVYNNIDHYNSRRNKKILITFDERRLTKTFAKQIHKSTQTNHIRCWLLILNHLLDWL